ncbi:uncharacterized protein [Ptychodera flava]|uniref:uncharacterized protein n=1 Tax=Ptychodera flava TaxID=63121 RepID=UPI00396A77BA
MSKPGRKCKERKNRGRPKVLSDGLQQTAKGTCETAGVNTENASEILIVIEQKAVRSLSDNDIPVDRCKAIQTLLESDNLDETPGFEELTTACIKRKLSATAGYKSGAPIKLKTKGQPLCQTYVPQARKVSGEVSERTKAMRAKWVEETRSRLAGGDDYSTVQQQKEIKRIKKDEKDVILGELGLTPNIPDGAGLILKSSLSLPWNKLRSLKRWLRSWRVNLGSERIERQLATNRKYPLSAVNLPFVFTVRGPDNKQDTEIRLAPCVAVQDLVQTVVSYLDYLESENKLTTHDGYIPKDQIWMKVGGDKGKGYMKSVFEICNVESPNSLKHSVVWNLFAAADSEVNLRTAMGVYKSRLTNLMAINGSK